MTIQEFWRLPEEGGYRLELVRGLVVREPAPRRAHGRTAARLTAALELYAAPRQLGEVLVNTGSVLSRTEQTVRVPDVCFVAAQGAAAQGPEESWLEGAPDLVIEVLSPSNRAGEMREKVADYMAAGCRLVWIVDPRRRCVTVHQPGQPPNFLQVQDVLDGAHVLPGFRLPLANLFAG